MVLAELRQLAGELNIADTAKMRKGDLIAAIKERQAGGPAPQLPLPETAATSTNGAGTADSAVDEAPAPTRRRRVASRPAGSPRKGAAAADGAAQATSDEPAGVPVEVPAAEVAPPVEATPPVEPAPEVAAPTVEPTPEVAAVAQPAEAPTDPVTPAAVETDGESIPRRSRQRRTRGERTDRADQGENGASVASPTVDVTPETTAEGTGDGGRREAGRENGRSRGDRGPRTDRTDDRGPRTDRIERGERTDRSDRSDRTDDRGGRTDDRN